MAGNEHQRTFCKLGIDSKGTEFITHIRYYSCDCMKSGGMGGWTEFSVIWSTSIWNYDRIFAPSDTLCSAPFHGAGKDLFSHRTLPSIDIIMILVILVFLSIWSDMLDVDSKF